MFSVKPVAYIKSPFTQKFGIPRQANLATEAIGELHFEPDVYPEEACRGIEQFSHLWLVFLFHKNIVASPKLTVRPPRLGGNKKIGVFASRASYRPNPIGMSVVKNLGLNAPSSTSADSIHPKVLRVAGIDMMNDTPIIDIKPYVGYSDTIVDPMCGYADAMPANHLEVRFSQNAQRDFDTYSLSPTLIEQVLSQDPRPAYKQRNEDKKQYFVSIHNVDICFHIENNIVFVTGLSPTES